MVRVPATINKSACRGEALKKVPMRSRSYLGQLECIISTAQQASPKDTGHMDADWAQFARASTFNTKYSPVLLKPAVGDLDGSVARGPFSVAGKWEEDMSDEGVVWSKVDLWDENKASFVAVCLGIRAAIWSHQQRERQSIYSFFLIRERAWCFEKDREPKRVKVLYLRRRYLN